MTTFEPHDHLDPARIIPPHEIRDSEKLGVLIGRMLTDGWTGRPLLVRDDGNGIHAWTGSHRVTAAAKANALRADLELPAIMVPVVYLDADLQWGDFCDDEDRLEAIEEAEGQEDAVALMLAEVEGNRS